MTSKTGKKTASDLINNFTRNIVNKDAPGDSKKKTFDRRLFLKSVGSLSVGAAVTASASNVLTTAEPEQKQEEIIGAAPQANHHSSSDRGKIQNIRSEIKEYKDSRTGARVRRLTGDGSCNVHPYFTSWAFVGNDANRVILVSDRSGAYQWYLLEVPSAQLVQLTSGENIRPNMACIDKNGRLHYFDGPVLRSIRLDTLEDRELYRVPNGFRPALPTCSADGNYIAFAYCQETTLSTETGRIYATMHERFYQYPHSVIMRVNAESGDPVAIWGEKSWVSHVCIHPTDPDIILFCHEGGSTCVHQRMWVVNFKDKQMRQAAPLYPQRKGESCVHEYFTQQGDVGVQYTLDSERGREQFNLFIRPDGTWIRQYLFPAGRPGHIQSNSDNSLVVGDGAHIVPDDKEGRYYIGLMTHENGRVQIRRLAWHGTSGQTQNSHGHPSFSPDDRWVIYSSDAEKCNNVYMAEVSSI